MCTTPISDFDESFVPTEIRQGINFHDGACDKHIAKYCEFVESLTSAEYVSICNSLLHYNAVTIQQLWTNIVMQRDNIENENNMYYELTGIELVNQGLLDDSYVVLSSNPDEYPLPF